MRSQARAKYGFKFYGGFFVLVLGSGVMYLASLAQGPDQDLSFVREVPSEVNASKLADALADVKIWPRWFYSTREVTLTDASVLREGAHLELLIDPKKGPWKKFVVSAEILRFEPGKRVRLKIVKDSNHKLDALFDRLEWEVELVPQGSGTLIRGTALAHTAHWRSRLFGKLVPRILMHQVFYPDLNRLSTIDRKMDSEENPG